MIPQKKTLHALLRTNLSAFIMKTFHTVDGSQEYVPNWHIELIADKLTRCMNGEIKRLIINLPPRSLKSVCASVAFPAWVLGHDPGKRIITVSYSDELSGKHARDFRSLMESGWYGEVFPNAKINPRKRTETELETTKNGYRLATSIGGTLTGRGGNLIIIDDPIKPQEALSDVKRNNVNHWYNNTLYSRLDNKNTDVIVIVMQRVHMDDLCGFVQDKGEWEILNLSAIAEKDEEYILLDGRKIIRKEGEALNPQLESLDILNNLKNTIGEYNFSAQYQQRPIPEEGGMLKWQWFGYYDDLPNNCEMVIQSWDTAMSDGEFADYSVCITAAVKNKQFYVMDIFRDRLIFPDLKHKILELHSQYKPKKLIIENKCSGISLIQQLKREHNIYPIAYEPKLSKKERIMVQSGLMESGQVLLPKNAAFLEELNKEVVTFPQEKYDDQLDALAQMLDKMRMYITGEWDTQEMEARDYNKFSLANIFDHIQESGIERRDHYW